MPAELELTTSYYLVLSALMFAIGATGLLIRRNPLVMFMCVELMLNAANLNFVAAATHYGDVDGWVFTAIAIAIAAAEVAIGLAILLSLYSTQGTISLDAARELSN